jgi:hypothetical protein
MQVSGFLWQKLISNLANRSGDILEYDELVYISVLFSGSYNVSFDKHFTKWQKCQLSGVRNNRSTSYLQKQEYVTGFGGKLAGFIGILQIWHEHQIKGCFRISQRQVMESVELTP